MNLKQLLALIQTKGLELDGLLNKGDEITAEDLTSAQGISSEIDALEKEAKNLRTIANVKSVHVARSREMATPETPAEVKEFAREAAAADPGFKSLGAQFTQSPEYKGFLKRVAPNGTVAEKAGGLTSEQVQIKTLVTGAGSTSGGPLVVPEYMPGLIPLPFKPLVLESLINVSTTQSDTIYYMRQNSRTNNAAPVAEATTVVTGQKPESALGYERVVAAVKTIAHWVPVTKRALSDAGQIRGYIDSDLINGLQQAKENQMLNGDGVGEDMTGILNTAGLLTQALVPGDLLATTRKAITTLQTVGLVQPQAFILSPLDWETIDLTKNAQGNYYFGGPAAPNAKTLWGIPVVTSLFMPAGTGLIGDYSQVTLWDREQASVQISDSHADFFTRNIVAILAELRAAFGVRRPASIVKIALA